MIWFHKGFWKENCKLLLRAYVGLLKCFVVPVSDVKIHLQPQYEYGTQDWINCTANVMDSSAASMILEVCHNESTSLPIEDISTILENSTISMNENCSVQLIRRYHFNFDSNINVSMRCSVHDHHYNTSTSSVCMIPNITTPMGSVLLYVSCSNLLMVYIASIKKK